MRKLPDPRFLRDNAPWLSAGVLLTFLSCFGQTYFISTFAGQIRESFGLSHGDWGAIYGAGTLAAAAIMLWAGGLTDHFRVRDLGSATLALLSVACLSMALVSASWALVIVILLLRLSGQGMCGHIATTAISRWFTTTRGRALAVATMGFALAEATMPLSFVSLANVVPWRGLWVLAAAIAAAGIVPLRLLMRTERLPQSVAEDGHAPGLGGRHWTRGEALRHPMFWMAVPALLGPPTFMTALFFHQVHLSEIKGFAHAQFVALFPIYTSVGLVTMVLWGLAIDRFGAIRLMPLVQLPLAVSFLVMAHGHGIEAAGLSLVAFSFTLGSLGSVPSAFIAELYGTRHIGAIRSVATALMVLGSAIGPALTGALIDQGFGFETQMRWFSIYFVATSALVWVGVRQLRPTTGGAALRRF